MGGGGGRGERRGEPEGEKETEVDTVDLAWTWRKRKGRRCMALLRAILLLHYKGAVQEGGEEKEEGSRSRKRERKWIRWAWWGTGISLIHTQ